MKLSLDWLKDFVDISDLTCEQVAEALTMGAFEVEEIKKVGSDIQGPVKVGEILEINPHPDANKIRLTKIKIDSAQAPLEIVCGAGNIQVGQLVPVALPGARVINRHDGTPLDIKPTKIRGVTSNGMLCSPPELGVTDGDSEGILILSKNTQIGLNVIELLQLTVDYVLHVSPRSNRGDALCVKGLAREIAALCKRPLKEPKHQLPSAIDGNKMMVQIENINDCPYFSLRIMENLKVGPSPVHIKRRLEAVGIRPVNNIVDITNYVMHELGHPLHAYDLNKLKTRQMSIRRAKSGEELIAINGSKYNLTEEMLIIAEEKCPLGIAGVMGGKDTEIDDSTVNIALEAATFHPAFVRRASRLLGLSSESSLRFERGVDVATVKQASDRAAALILECCGKDAQLGSFADSGNDKVESISITLRPSQVKRLAEIDLKPEAIAEMLKPLAFESKIVNADKLEVSIPSFRQRDVSREIDLIEDVLRIWGYNQIPASMPYSTGAPIQQETIAKNVSKALWACGLHEIRTSSLVAAEEKVDESQLKTNNSNVVYVLNPLSDDHRVMRQSLLPGLIQAVSYNQDRGRRDAWLYEIGHAYKKAGTVSSKETGVQEDLMASCIIAGNESMSGWYADAKTNDQSNFYIAKGIVENTLDKSGINQKQIVFRPIEGAPAESKYFHPGRSCIIEIKYQGKNLPIGLLGDIHPGIANKAKLTNVISIFELNLQVLAQLTKNNQFTEVFTTPFTTRDLTIDLDQSTDHSKVVECITKAAGLNLRVCELISVFPLPEGKRSLSYRLTFQDKEITLTNEAIEKDLNQLRDKLKSELRATFRV